MIVVEMGKNSKKADKHLAKKFKAMVCLPLLYYSSIKWVGSIPYPSTCLHCIPSELKLQH